ncbi:hypothetical protein L195_g064580, partial [Trifolium pratense]
MCHHGLLAYLALTTYSSFLNLELRITPDCFFFYGLLQTSQ